MEITLHRRAAHITLQALPPPPLPENGKESGESASSEANFSGPIAELGLQSELLNEMTAQRMREEQDDAEVCAARQCVSGRG